MRICVVGSTYPRHHDDPLVPWLREAVGRMARRGHEMTVVVPSFEGLPSHTIDGVPVLRFRYAPRAVERLTHDQGAPNKLRNPLYNLLAPPYIASGAAHLSYWAARRRFDVLHVHWPFPHSVLTSLAWTPRVPTVATCHGAELALARKNRLIAHTLRRSLLGAHAVSCNSSHTRGEIDRLCGRAAQIIPYGATVPGATVRTWSDGSGEATLLFCGRLIQRKGIDYLLRALPAILAVRSVRLLITGEGDRKEEWQRLASSLGLADRVQFLGFVSTERLAELYRTCDVYVHPAIYDDAHDTEGLGVSLIEALFNGAPVVASDVGGIVDVIKHDQTGLLVPEKDAAALAKAVLQVLGDRSLAVRLGEGGRRFAETHFDWERITDETEALYRRVVAASGGNAPREVRAGEAVAGP
ncbi:MAG: glycosyltransferase family 4 protein [Polyangiaceae bacterium]